MKIWNLEFISPFGHQQLLKPLSRTSGSLVTSLKMIESVPE